MADMSKTVLADLVDRQVQSTVVATLGRSIDRVAESMAEELLRDAAFRAECLALIRAAFKRALVDLTTDTP